MRRSAFIEPRRTFRPLSWSPSYVNLDSPQAQGLVLWYLPTLPGHAHAGATLAGTAAFVTDHEMLVGVNLPGTAGNHVNLGDPSSVDFGAGDFCICLWVKMDQPTSNAYQILIGKDTSTGRQFVVGYNPNADTNRPLVVAYWVAGAAVQLNGTNNSIADSALHHIVAQRVGNTFELYLDGVLNNTGTTLGTHGTMSATTSSLLLGQRGFSSFEQPFDGQLFDVRFYANSHSARTIWQMWDARTRWELYQTPRATLTMDLGGAGIVIPAFMHSYRLRRS